VTVRPVDNDASVEKSEGQQLLDRMLAQCNRFNRLRKRLDEVRGSIAPSRVNRPAAAPAGSPPAPATSFFEGLAMLADGNDKIADELEESVEDLAKLF
jgi:hypothetical protein